MSCVISKTLNTTRSWLSTLIYCLEEHLVASACIRCIRIFFLKFAFKIRIANFYFLLVDHYHFVIINSTFHLGDSICNGTKRPIFIIYLSMHLPNPSKYLNVTYVSITNTLIRRRYLSHITFFLK